MIHPKAALIERLQSEGRGQPQFVTQREGPDHEPTFRAQVRVQGKAYGKGEAGNKREAERRAAQAALERLNREAAGRSGRTHPKGRRKAATAATADDAPADAAAAPDDAAIEAAAAAAAGVAAQPAAGDEAPAPAAVTEEAFAGPWPLFERVLAECLRIAHERVDAGLRGDVALAGVEAFALRLYQDVLEELGEVVDDYDGEGGDDGDGGDVAGGDGYDREGGGGQAGD